MLVEFPSIGQAILAALRGNSFACFAAQYSGAARNTVRLSGSAGRNPEACLIAIYFFSLPFHLLVQRPPIHARRATRLSWRLYTLAGVRKWRACLQSRVTIEGRIMVLAFSSSVRQAASIVPARSLRPSRPRSPASAGRRGAHGKCYLQSNAVMSESTPAAPWYSKAPISTALTALATLARSQRPLPARSVRAA